MNKENFGISEEFKKEQEQLELEVLIYKKLEDFKKTRAIATAVEICDVILKARE